MRFKHGITRDAIYRTIGRKERQALHRRVVEAIRGEAESRGEQGLLDALAYHYAASGDIARAVPYAIRAGDAALAAGALDRAQAHYRSAFENVAAEGDGGPLAHLIWPLFNKYGLACIVDPAPDQLPVMREMARRLRTLGNAEALVRGEYWIGAIAYGLGEGKQSVVHLAQALRAAVELGQTRFIPQIEIKLAQSLFAAGRYTEADALFTRVLPVIAQQPGRADHETYAYALCCHGFLYADQGNFAAAESRYAAADRVRGSSAPPMLASYLTQKSAVCLFRGEWEEAIEEARRCLEACGRARARYQAMMSKALAAYAQWRIDRDPDAVETLAGRGALVRLRRQPAAHLAAPRLADRDHGRDRPRRSRTALCRPDHRPRAADRRPAGRGDGLSRARAAGGGAWRCARHPSLPGGGVPLRGNPRLAARGGADPAVRGRARAGRGDPVRAARLRDAARAAFAAMGMPRFAAPAAACARRQPAGRDRAPLERETI